MHFNNLFYLWENMQNIRDSQRASLKPAKSHVWVTAITYLQQRSITTYQQQFSIQNAPEPPFNTYCDPQRSISSPTLTRTI